MARMKKEEVIGQLEKIPSIKFDKNDSYNDLCKLLKQNTNDPTNELGLGLETVGTPKIYLESRIKKKNIFLADSYRNEKDAAVLNKEIGKREHKGKIKCITTIKRMEVTMSGDWLTEFVIELK